MLWPGATELEVVTGTGTGTGTTRPRRWSRSRRGAGPGPACPTSPCTGLVVGGKVRRPPGAVHAVVGGRTYRTSPGVFWQVHTGAAAALLAAVLDLVGPCDGAAVVDLYAGAGLFSVPLADAVGPSGAVLAVERDRRACADARHNGATFPNLRVLEGEVTPALVETGLGRPDIVVLDPAREGAGNGRHAGARRRTHRACAGSSMSRATPLPSGATAASSSTRAGVSAGCAPSTSFP